MALFRLCGKRKIHLVSDEIYALSVYDSGEPGAVPFTSVLSLNKEGLIDEKYVHVLYGLSKVSIIQVHLLPPDTNRAPRTSAAQESASVFSSLETRTSEMHVDKWRKLEPSVRPLTSPTYPTQPLPRRIRTLHHRRHRHPLRLNLHIHAPSHQSRPASRELPYRRQGPKQDGY